MTAFLGQKQLFSPSQPVWWAGVMLSLGIGGLLYSAAYRSIEYEATERFVRQARNAQYNITSGITAYTSVLRSTASFFEAHDKIDRASFRRYVQGLQLDSQFPALDSINYAPYLTDAQRADFERSLSGSAAEADGYPDLQIAPFGRRSDYTVITMIEPLRHFRDKVGFDLNSKPMVALALAHARDTGEPSASGVPVDLINQPLGAGLAMRMPVYRPGMPLDDVAQRRAAYLGSVGIGFSVPRLVQSALDQMEVPGVRLVLYESDDVSGASRAIQLFDSQKNKQATQRPYEQFTTVLPIEFNGRHWKASFSGARKLWYSHLDTLLPWLAMLGGFIGAMLFYLLFHTLSSSRLRAIQMAKAMTKELRDSQAKLQQSHHKLRRLAAHADQIKEQERKRIAREIHDDLGQNLLVLRIEADMLATRTRDRHPRLHARARSTLGQIDSTIKSVRHIINDLRPTVLDLGLNAAVEWQIAQFRQRSGMVCELIEHQPDIRVDDHCATAFFRVLQESLSNILQHARASLVRVELRLSAGMLSMTISDNGVGMHASNRNKVGSFGLVGIEERISLLGGHCSISGSPGAGTTVTVSVPDSYSHPVQDLDNHAGHGSVTADLTM